MEEYIEREICLKMKYKWISHRASKLDRLFVTIGLNGGLIVNTVKNFRIP
jgi:hypothetical protein